jgi:hypothetical protein
MRRLTAGLFVFAGNAWAHPGHGAPKGHFHGLGFEHALLLALVLALLAYAVKK